MTVHLRIAAITSNSGETISLPRSGVTCIVGGNNVGKSQLLRDLVQPETEVYYTPIVLSGAQFERSGSKEEFDLWLRANAVTSDPEPGKDTEYRPITGGRAERLERLVDSWSGSTTGGSRDWARFLMWFSSAGKLASVASGSGRGSPNSYIEPESPLLRRLLRSGSAEGELSSLTRDLFDEPVVLDRLSDDLRLRVGRLDTDIPPLDRPTPEYERAVAALPLLKNQGDGIQSFAGLALAMIASAQQILIVDEPEAFLHPAQARSLGRWIASDSLRRDRQVILATHDKDVVLGLLESDEPVTIVRVSRKAKFNSIRALNADDLGVVWADPVLRYSNVLQGLFYEQVVICEADADCRFYSAVMDGIVESEATRARANGTLFVPAGGKQRSAVLARSLTSLGVRIASMPDFDILNSKGDLRALLEASGGAWSDEINQAYTEVSSWVNQQPKGWERAKNQGLSMLKEGQVYESGETLLSLLKAQGLHIVPYGEMEGLDRTIGLHGSRWVSEMLARDGHTECRRAKLFVEPLLAGEREDDRRPPIVGDLGHLRGDRKDVQPPSEVAISELQRNPGSDAGVRPEWLTRIVRRLGRGRTE